MICLFYHATIISAWHVKCHTFSNKDKQKCMWKKKEVIRFATVIWKLKGAKIIFKIKFYQIKNSQYAYICFQYHSFVILLGQTNKQSNWSKMEYHQKCSVYKPGNFYCDHYLSEKLCILKSK